MQSGSMLNNWMYWHTDTHKAQIKFHFFPQGGAFSPFSLFSKAVSTRTDRHTLMSEAGNTIKHYIRLSRSPTPKMLSVVTDTLAASVSATYFLCLRKLKCQLSQMGKEIWMYLTIPAHPHPARYISKQRGKDREITPLATTEYYAECTVFFMEELHILQFHSHTKNKCITSTVRHSLSTVWCLSYQG